MVDMAKSNLQLKLEGADELVQTFRRLTRGMRKRALRKALGKGAKPIYDQVRATVPKRTKALRKSIRRKVKMYRDGESGFAMIGPDAAAQYVGPDGRRNVPNNYFHLVDQGVKPHVITGRLRFIPSGGQPALGRGGRLMSAMDSAAVYVRRVEHPGVLPRRILEQAIALKGRAAQRAMAAELQAALRKELEKARKKR